MRLAAVSETTTTEPANDNEQVTVQLGADKMETQEAILAADAATPAHQEASGHHDDNDEEAELWKGRYALARYFVYFVLAAWFAHCICLVLVAIYVYAKMESEAEALRRELSHLQVPNFVEFGVEHGFLL